MSKAHSSLIERRMLEEYVNVRQNSDPAAYANAAAYANGGMYANAVY